MYVYRLAILEINLNPPPTKKEKSKNMKKKVLFHKEKNM